MGSCSLTAPVLLRNHVHSAFLLIVIVVLTVINKIVYEMMTRFFLIPPTYCFDRNLSILTLPTVKSRSINHSKHQAYPITFTRFRSTSALLLMRVI